MGVLDVYNLLDAYNLRSLKSSTIIQVWVRGKDKLGGCEVQ